MEGGLRFISSNQPILPPIDERNQNRRKRQPEVFEGVARYQTVHTYVQKLFRDGNLSTPELMHGNGLVYCGRCLRFATLLLAVSNVSFCIAFRY